ncbi:type I restriction enzyme, S subunit [Persephonella hydrogeniphila]|uniref:Type I restriction enzyme, S subunit n=1 Tax=Persephonella hydrogeniphila TaxID=198703 RepID=A0A285NBV6_9AQUI|nr:restriction endonuclease subunit S [Persephonella hydrogeniphila]SNZ06972.1 type I restriction enzyme, S subunit [Persephonella hydrogeniphila]
MTEEKNKTENLPKGWKRVKLGEVLREPKKAAIKKNEYNKFELLTVKLHLKGVAKTGKFPKWTPKGRPYFIRFENEFLLGRQNFHNGGFGIVDKSTNGLIASNAISSFVSTNKSNIKFIFYNLARRFLHKEFDFLMEGTGQQEISVKKFLNLLINLPPLPEQQKIAEILETVDNTIEKTEKIIEKYKRIKQGLMQDLLTKGIDENGKIRNEKTHKFKNSPLGKIPEEWEVVKLVEIVKNFQYGISDTLLKKGKYKIIKMDDIQGWYVKIKNEQYVNIPLSTFKKYKLNRGDILINRTNSMQFVGRPSYFDLKGDYVFASYLIRLFTNSKKVDNLFLTILISFYHEKLKNLATPAVQQANINANSLKAFQIPLPPLPEQKRIASVLSQIDETIEKETAYKEKLQHLKKGLMEDLLTGKVRVKI